ncbi:ankyrin repeat domain-containing protein [Flavobacterium rakeshii]|uniref:Ankyrin repeat domain-containing protein n=1 Tax=Flavobacterium rakeshii TaxID=1038845 RepID=A0A6N8HF71_9FLAO|nr:ankyrin repeat domain-containing protein [Flavobacterium rakeshii]MEE1898648.1 ankyrin repeat domain-containing protein [Flavobacterium rakeshii]MUV04360.1 ankyrin repeat domain-containing protein [Flavobacterium rakeshii]
MKKTIIYLGLAIFAFSNAAMASTTVQPASAGFELVKEYKTNTPLCNAICKGDVDTVKKFIEYGVDVNETSNGKTPLMLAARYNNVEILKLLIDNGAYVLAKDERGQTAEKYAEASNATEALEFLKNA